MRCWMSATPRVGWSVRARRRFLQNRLWWRCSRPAGLAPAARGRRGRRPAPPGLGSRAAAGGPAGTRSALDAARERRGIGRVAARTAGPRPVAGARARRRHRRRGRSLARGWRPASLSRGCAAGPGPSAVKVAAPAPAVRRGLELALELHQAPDLSAVGTDVRLDVGGQLADGDQVDAEQLRALLQRRRDRPGQVGLVPSPHRGRVPEHTFEE